MNDFHLTGVCVFSILAVCGCSPRIDRPAIEANLRKTDPTIKKFLEAYPNADVSIRSRRSFGAIYDDPRIQHAYIRHELADGIAVSMSANLRVESDGVSFSFADDSQGWLCSLSSRSCSRNIFLSESQLKALLSAGGELASLKPFDKTSAYQR